MTFLLPDAWTLDILVETYREYQRRTRGLRKQVSFRQACVKV